MKILEDINYLMNNVLFETENLEINYFTIYPLTNWHGQQNFQTYSDIYGQIDVLKLFRMC